MQRSVICRVLTPFLFVCGVCLSLAACKPASREIDDAFVKDWRRACGSESAAADIDARSPLLRARRPIGFVLAKSLVASKKATDKKIRNSTIVLDVIAWDEDLTANKFQIGIDGYALFSGEVSIHKSDGVHLKFATLSYKIPIEAINGTCRVNLRYGGESDVLFNEDETQSIHKALHSFEISQKSSMDFGCAVRFPQETRKRQKASN